MHACLNAIVKHDVDRDGRVDRYHCRTLIDTTPEVLVSLPRTAIPTSNHGIHDELGRLHPRPCSIGTTSTCPGTASRSDFKTGPRRFLVNPNEVSRY
jgi:hypothetical protein